MGCQREVAEGRDQNVSRMCFLQRFTHLVITYDCSVNQKPPGEDLIFTVFCFILFLAALHVAFCVLELSEVCCEIKMQWAGFGGQVEDGTPFGMKQKTKNHTKASCRRQGVTPFWWHLFSLGAKHLSTKFMRIYRSNFLGMFKKFSLGSGGGGSYLDIQINS